jgi:hypothetical protein
MLMQQLDLIFGNGVELLGMMQADEFWRILINKGSCDFYKGLIHIFSQTCKFNLLS